MKRIVLAIGLAIGLASAPASAGWYQNDAFRYRVNFPDSWTVAEDAANNAVRANKPDGSIQTAIQAIDLQGKINSADVLADLFTNNIFKGFRFLQKANDAVNGIPGVAAAYAGSENGRAAVVGAFYIVQPPHGFVLYSVLDEARVQALAQESDAVFNTFARTTAAPAAGPGLGGLLSGALGAASSGADPCAQIPGTWRWFTGSNPDFRADGTINGDPNHRWSCDPARRVVTVVWSNGTWIDTLAIAADGRKLEGRNQAGNPVWGTR